MPSTKPDQDRPYPCLTAEIIDELAVKQSLEGLPAVSDPLPSRLTYREGLLFHFFVFLIGSWNLVLIDLAHTPGRYWCWSWIAAWAAIVVLHLGLVLALAHRTRRRRQTGHPVGGNPRQLTDRA